MQRNIGPTRRGMTLVELLVVIGIVVVLVAIAAPVMRPQLKDRKLREASRQLNTFISTAKARAAGSNRGHGFRIVRDTLPDRNQGAYQVFFVETPIPFAGETINEQAELLRRATGVPTSLPQVPTGYEPISPDGFANVARIVDTYDIVKAGDFIQFDYRGPKYCITSAQMVTGKKEITFASPYRMPFPMLRASGGPPFQVHRQPIKAAGAPLELASGTVIDLQWSGTGKSGVEMDSAGDIIVLFSPNGAVERLYDGTNVKLPDATIHMLVGRADQLTNLQDNPSDLTKSNLLDPTVSWVSIGHLTGTVTTAENYVEDPVSMAAATAAANLPIARTIATSKQTMGGR